MFAALVASVALAQATPLEDPAAAFGTLPLLSGLEVSPDGNNYAALVRTGGRQGLGIFSVDGGIQFKHFINDEDEKKLSNFFWKRDDYVVFSTTLPGRRGRTKTVETRLFSINVDNGNMSALLARAFGDAERPPQIQDNFVSLLPQDPNNILLEYRKPRERYSSVFKVTIDRPRPPTVVQETVNNSVSFRADLSGTVRYSYGIRNDTERRLAMITPGGEWKDFSHRVSDEGPSFFIAGFPNDRRFAYILSDHEFNTRALYRFDIEADDFAERLFAHPTSDVLRIRQDPDTGEAIGAVFAEDDASIAWFNDNRPRATANAIKEAMGYDKVSFVRYNLSRSAAVLFVSSGIEPGNFIVFDYATGEIVEMPNQYPALARTTLGDVVSTTYEARDGLDIPAFVTMPPGYSQLSELRRLPFIILPHGGPTARDYRGFDWLAQFLAHKGYGVLQMNFRGSAGYGAEFEDAGDRQWGQAMQDDITDGTRWLIENGYADEDQVSILGASYGGYAALMGAVREPDLFQCAVSINGVTDLPKVIADARDFIGGELGTRHIGRLWSDRRMLRENSPSQNADAIQIPILLIASEEDRRVPRAHSYMMKQRLERAGKDVELVLLPEGSHYLNVNDNRITALRAIDRFLDDCR